MEVDDTWFPADVGMQFPETAAEREHDRPHEEAPVYLDLDSICDAAERRGLPVDREATRKLWAQTCA